MNELIIGIIIAAGIPSATLGFLIRRLEHKLDLQEQARKEREEARIEHEVLLIEMSVASLSLGEATAEAVQRIPDANCNGEMTEALQRAKDTKENYRKFERKQAAKVATGGAI